MLKKFYFTFYPNVGEDHTYEGGVESNRNLLIII